MLLKHRLRGRLRVGPSTITEEDRRQRDLMIARHMVVTLVANRIMQGLAPIDVLRKMGWTAYENRDLRYLQLTVDEWAAIEINKIEQALLDTTDADEQDWHDPGRLSTLMRYTQALGGRTVVNLRKSRVRPPTFQSYPAMLRVQRARVRRRRRAGLRVPARM